jgi:hypothetical protein
MARDKVNYSNLFSHDTQEIAETTKTEMKEAEILTILNNNNQKSQQQDQTQLTTTGNFNQEQISILSKLPFWITDPTEHAHIFDETGEQCCFNHYVGLPYKYGTRLPLFDYQVAERYKGQPSIFQAFENNNCVYVLKATGIGFSDLTLRYMCWKAHTGTPNQYRNSQMVIVTGPNIELATKQITRIRSLYNDKLGILFSSEKTKIVLPPNNVMIQAYPSHNVAAMRGLPKVSIVFIDEGDFFPVGQQLAVRDAAERYLGKSNAKIILGSTPYSIDGLMHTIQKEENSIYTKLFLNYEVGLNKIFSKKDIEKAKQSPSFEREYNLRYAFDIGNVLTEQLIQRCLDIKYDPNYVVYECPKSIGIDPSYGSSKFAIVVTQFMDGRIQVLYADEFERPDPFEMERLALDLTRQYGLFEGTTQNGQLLVDGANVNFIKSMKHMLNENIHYEDEKVEDHIYKRVRPINFGTTHRALLSNMIELVSKGYVAIDPKFENLLNQLRVAQMDANLSLIKKPLTLDLVDAFRLSLFGFQIR